jgi:hypothetical protein
MRTRTDAHATGARRTRALLAVLAAGALVAISGCAQAQRSAEQVVDALGPVGGPFLKDTRICVINESSVRPTVTFDRKDNSWGEGVLERSPSPNDRACGEGGFATEPDVRAIVKHGIEHDPPVLGYEFNGYDPFGLEPRVVVKQLFAAERYGVTSVCVGEGGWDEGLRIVVNDGGPLVYVVQRQADSRAFKEFTVTIRDNDKPVTAGPFAGASQPCNELLENPYWNPTDAEG